ncbi:MAG: ORF6N domain-containing protein [Acidobacteriaceae bacterium]|nr:ORF6N domain-containing protein [Acidobacteriaceae bacterium]
MPSTETAPVLESRIWLIRGHKVLLDADLAELYQVTTGNLNLAVRRNKERFPPDFMFQLTKAEFDNLRLQIARASWGGRRTPPYAFTEQGIAMLSGVLTSARAVEVNIAIMRTFVRLRQLLATHEELARRLDQLEWRQNEQGQQIHAVFETIQHLIEAPADEPKRRIGFPTSRANREPQALDEEDKQSPNARTSF